MTDETTRLHEDLCYQRERADAAMSEVRAKEATIERLTRELAVARDDMRDCRTMLSAAEEERDVLRAAIPTPEQCERIDLYLHHDEDHEVMHRLARLSPPSAPHRALVRLLSLVVCACFQPPGSWCKTLGMPCGGTSAPAQDGAERCEPCEGDGYDLLGVCAVCNGTGKARR